jgi:iron complex transport system ATP-binding protein
MITLENISCGYGKKEILADVNISIQEAQLTCLIGKNGVGKTTLFKTILGLLPALKGQIKFNGKNIHSLSCAELARQISYVPQAHGAPFPFKVLDVVLMGQHVHTSGFFGKPAKHNVDIAVECIQALRIEKLMHKNFSKISGGEKQMVLIARAMAQQPRFIAMDEPTANLDLGNQVRVLKVAQILKEKGYGVIMNTHSPEQALQFADNLIMLKKGGIAKVGIPSEIIRSETVSDLYNTPVELVETFTSAGESRKILLTL